MKLLSSKTSLSSVMFVAACSFACALTGCGDDDDGDHDGTGGKYGSGGSSSGGKNGSGGSSSGGKPASGGASSGGGGSSGGGTSGAGGQVPDSGAGGYPADSGAPDSGDPGPTEAGVRLVHAAAAAPAVDVYRKGSTTPIARDISYGEATGYVTIDAGTYQFELRPAGAAASTAPAFTTPDVTVEGGKKYTAVAAGDLASSTAADGFRILPLEEGFGDNVAGKSRVRLVHAAYDAPTVAVDFGNDDGTAPEVTAVARFGVTDAEGAEVDSGELLQIGVVVNQSAITAFTTPELPDAKNVFVIASGLTSKPMSDPLGLQAIAVLPDSTTVFIKQNPRIYAVHASPDAGAVDVFSGSTEVIDNTTFGKLSVLQVPPGAVTLDFFAAAAGKSTRPVGAPAASGSTPALQAGNSYVAVAAGTVTAPATFQLLTAAESFDGVTASQARLRVIHASADAPAVDIGTVTTAGTLVTPPLFVNAKYKDVTPAAGTVVPVGALTLGLAATGYTATAAEFSVTTTAGEKSFVIAAGTFAGATYPLQLLKVNTTGLIWSIAAVPKK
jgi:hypothetical protein